MIEGKTIKFGYGSIVTGVCFSLLLFHSVKPPFKVGYRIKRDDKVNVVDRVTFKFGVDMYSFLSQLKRIDEEHRKIEFRGYTFDFTNFHEESVSAVIEAVETVMSNIQMTLAC